MIDDIKLDDALVYKNRLTVIEYLKDPARKKAVGKLRAGGADGEDDRRCCLGHMCDVLGIEAEWSAEYGIWAYNAEGAVAPDSVVRAVGLYTNIGAVPSRNRLPSGKFALSSTNDDTGYTPQMIGQMLEDMILGGPDTPWRKIRI